MDRSPMPPPDLEIRVRIEPAGGKIVLMYLLHSTSGKAGFNFKEVRGPELSVDPKVFAHQFFDQIEKLPFRDSGLDQKLVGAESVHWVESVLA